MRRIFALTYGLVAYALFLAAITYAIGFVGGFVVPKTLDSGAPAPLAEALLVNLGLLGLFAVQHTIMARPAFKRWFTRFVPVHLERSTFVAVASLLLLATYWQWRPLPDVIWAVEDTALAAAITAVSALGWAVVLASSFMIDHFDLFGLRQVISFVRGRPHTHPQFLVRGLYRWVRHPLMVGFILAFWATPTMTVGHLVFAGATTGYILLGVRIEERDLVGMIGHAYEQYRQRVPMLVPGLRRRAVPATGEAAA